MLYSGTGPERPSSRQGIGADPAATGSVVPFLESPKTVAARLGGAALLLAFLYFVSVPAEPRYRLCAFHWLTGRLCPLCGLTRGLFALAKGRLREAEHFNALSPLGFAMLFSLFWSRQWRELPWAKLWTSGIAAFALYGVLRAVVV
jgi:hypothetical protein